MRALASNEQRSLCGLFFGLICGCSAYVADIGESEEVDEVDLADVEQELATYPLDNLFHVNNYIVDVCWVAPGFSAEKQQVQEAVTYYWDEPSGLTFRWPDSADELCDVEAVGAEKYMPLLITSGPWGGKCTAGVGARLTDCPAHQYTPPGQSPVTTASNSCQCYFTDANNQEEIDRLLTVGILAIHEVGHGIGIAHEHQREDRPADIHLTCPVSAPLSQWEGELNADGSVKNPDIVKQTLGLLTPYDPEAGVSYCRDLDRDGQPDANNYVRSAMDFLGIEMLYPRNFSRRPTALGGVMNSDGSQTIVRSDVATRLVPDWVARGGLPTALHNVRWRFNNFTPIRSPTIAPTFSGNLSVALELDDPLGVHHSWTSTSIVVDNSLHTAILQTQIL